MPDQPAPALLAAARAYALSVWTYDPAAYRSPEHRDKHIHVDAIGTTRQPWFAALWAAGLAEGRRQATEGQPDRAVLVRLVRELVDQDECWFDHHGGCQAHGYLSLEPGEQCPHAEAKALVGPWEPAEARDA